MGEGFRAVPTHGPGPGLSDVLRGQVRSKINQPRLPLPSLAAAGDLQLSPQGVSCEVGAVRASVPLRLGKLRHRAGALTGLSSGREGMWTLLCFRAAQKGPRLGGCTRAFGAGLLGLLLRTEKRGCDPPSGLR